MLTDVVERPFRKRKLRLRDPMTGGCTARVRGCGKFPEAVSQGAFPIITSCEVRPALVLGRLLRFSRSLARMRNGPSGASTYLPLLRICAEEGQRRVKLGDKSQVLNVQLLLTPFSVKSFTWKPPIMLKSSTFEPVRRQQRACQELRKTPLNLSIRPKISRAPSTPLLDL